MYEGAPAPSARFDMLWTAIFAKSAELVFALDGRRRVLAVSEGFVRRFGPSVADVVGHVCADVAHEGGVIPDECPMHDLILDGEQHSAEVHSDRLEGDFLVRVTPVLDDAGEFESERRMRRALAFTSVDQFVTTPATLDEALGRNTPM